MAETPLQFDSATETDAAPRIARGVCHVFFAYDVGFSIDLAEAERLISATSQRQVLRHKRRAPAWFQYEPPPLRVTQAAEPIAIGGHQTAPGTDAVLYDFGAISITYAIPLCGSLEGLLELSDALYGNAALLADSRRRVEALLATARGAVIRPALSDFVEDYAVYQVELFDPPCAPQRLFSERAALLARILRSEQGGLSVQEVTDALAARIAYTNDDAAVIDWNAALLIGADTDDVRPVLEFANVELLEMRHLDQRLDDTLNESYALLAARPGAGRRLFHADGASLERVAALQTDAAMLFEGVNNAIKLIGDQYLARVSRLAAQRFHLDEWDAGILRKLQTVESIYEKMVDRQNTRRMEVLEWIIIVLIAVSIGVSIWPGSGH